MRNPIAHFSLSLSLRAVILLRMDDQSEKVQHAIDLLSSITNSASQAPGRSRVNVGGADCTKVGKLAERN